MSLLIHTLEYTAPAAYSLLPESWQSPEATAEVLAIGLQETQFNNRRQVPRYAGWQAPARSFWQFEISGVKEALTNSASASTMEQLLRALRYPVVTTAERVLAAIEHNDVLAFGMARGLLRTVRRRLPKQGESLEAYEQYLIGWKPNKQAAAKHADDWPGNFLLAWDTVLQAAIAKAVRREGET